MLTASLVASDYTIAPDGTYVSGNKPIITPKGNYVGGDRFQITPNGNYIGVYDKPKRETAHQKYLRKRKERR